MSIGSHFENLLLNINISIVATRSFQPNVICSVYCKMLWSGHLYRRSLFDDPDFPSHSRGTLLRQRPQGGAACNGRGSEHSLSPRNQHCSMWGWVQASVPEDRSPLIRRLRSARSHVALPRCALEWGWRLPRAQFLIRISRDSPREHGGEWVRFRSQSVQCLEALFLGGAGGSVVWATCDFTLSRLTLQRQVKCIFIIYFYLIQYIRYAISTCNQY